MTRNNSATRLARPLLYACLWSFLLPLLPLALWSVAEAWPWPSLVPPTFSTRAWQLAWSDNNVFLAPLVTSLGIAALVTAFAIPLSLPVGRLLGLYAFPGKAWLNALMLTPILLPSFTAAMGLTEVLARLPLAEGWLLVVLLHLVALMPYMVRSLQAAYAVLGSRLEDQARTLGASSWLIFRRVTLPRLLPALLLGSTFVFLGSLGDYLLTMLATGGNLATLPVVLYPYIAAGDRPIAAVGSLILAAAPLVAMTALELALRRQPGLPSRAPL